RSAHEDRRDRPPSARRDRRWLGRSRVIRRSPNGVAPRSGFASRTVICRLQFCRDLSSRNARCHLSLRCGQRGLIHAGVPAVRSVGNRLDCNEQRPQEAKMDSALVMSRLQFAFTISYHYLFPQFTMGLALLIVIMKTIALRRSDERYNQAVRFWSKIFAVTFILGVVTGIPMEFQFGTNWAQFSTYAGNIIAQTLAMEGAFAFFLESAFVGVLLFGEQRFGQKVHWFAAVMVWLGTWASGFFIIASNAWMQHPVGYTPLPDGSGVKITDYWAVLFNYWILPQYLHTMGGAVVTGAFVMAGLGAYYVLLGRHVEYGRIFVKVGVIAGVIASILQLYPSGDMEGSQVAHHQPTKLAAMEGLFHTTEGAGIVIIGQPDTEKQTMDNAISIPRALSFLTYRRWTATVKGLNDFPRDAWPDSIPLLYYSYHIMVGLGT